VSKLLDNGERAHPSIILTRVFMAAGLAYTISNLIFGETIHRRDLSSSMASSMICFALRATLNALRAFTADFPAIFRDRFPLGDRSRDGVKATI